MLDVDGRAIGVTNLDKVLYPESGTRKFGVIDYYTRIADAMLPHLRRRIVTRKRWPSGVDAAPFFEEPPGGSPEWLDRYGRALKRAIVYPVISDRADLVWMAQMAALELHVPQWRIDGGPGQEGLANRIIFDLDPGPGVPLTQCAQIAILIRDVLAGAGLQSWPVTSGGKGIHVYARIDPPVSPDSARAVARELAEGLSAAHPDAITATMTRPCAKTVSSSTGARTADPRRRSRRTRCAAAHSRGSPRRARGRNSPTPIWHNSRCTRYSSASKPTAICWLVSIPTGGRVPTSAARTCIETRSRRRPR